jgi:hypothetical protein
MGRTLDRRPAPLPAGKSLATRFVSAIERAHLVEVMERLELFARTLQSKGVDTSLADQIKSVSRFIPAGAIVFEVGANVGNWTRALLASCGSPKCTVSSRWRRTSLRSPHRRVTVHPFAVGAQEEVRDPYSNFEGSGLTSLYERDTPDARRFASR